MPTQPILPTHSPSPPSVPTVVNSTERSTNLQILAIFLPLGVLLTTAIAGVVIAAAVITFLKRRAKRVYHFSEEK